MTLRVGLIVNPMAGLGGPVALRGSDGVADEAMRRGAVPQAQERAGEALGALRAAVGPLTLLTGSDVLGAHAAAAAGLPYSVVYEAQPPTSSVDTEMLARKLASLGVDLLLFAGGDGTARDIAGCMGNSIPVLGIPAGVKMYSGVFATTPQAAGLLARDFLASTARSTRATEVIDVDESQLERAGAEPRLFGYLASPQDPRLLQGRKVRSLPSERAQVQSIVQEVVEEMDDDCLYLVGPGSTTWALKQRMGGEGSMLGVDVYRAGALVATDVTASELEHLTLGQPAHALVTCIGGQGHIFGRGNQQFSPRLLRRLGREHVTVLATPHKLAGLRGRPFIADVADPLAAERMTGLVKVVSGYRSEAYYRCEAV